MAGNTLGDNGVETVSVIDTLSADHIVQLHQLYQQTWWTKARTLEQTQRVVEGSPIVIGLVDGNNALVGFARVLTDYICKAIIFDFIVAETARKRGLGDRLMKLIQGHPSLVDVQHIELYCLPEMTRYYQQYGFSDDTGGLRLMRSC